MDHRMAPYQIMQLHTILLDKKHLKLTFAKPNANPIQCVLNIIEESRRTSIILPNNTKYILRCTLF